MQCHHGTFNTGECCLLFRLEYSFWFYTLSKKVRRVWRNSSKKCDILNLTRRHDWTTWPRILLMEVWERYSFHEWENSVKKFAEKVKKKNFFFILLHIFFPDQTQKFPLESKWNISFVFLFTLKKTRYFENNYSFLVEKRNVKKHCIIFLLR